MLFLTGPEDTALSQFCLLAGNDFTAVFAGGPPPRFLLLLAYAPSFSGIVQSQRFNVTHTPTVTQPPPFTRHAYPATYLTRWTNNTLRIRNPDIPLNLLVHLSVNGTSILPTPQPKNSTGTLSRQYRISQ